MDDNKYKIPTKFLQSPGGITMVGMPDSMLLIMQRIHQKTGHDIVNILGAAIHEYANKVLSNDDKIELARALKGFQ